MIVCTKVMFGYLEMYEVGKINRNGFPKVKWWKRSLLELPVFVCTFMRSGMCTLPLLMLFVLHMEESCRK